MPERTIVTRLNDYIYCLDDNHEATGYLVVGGERAALVDTMNGLEDLRPIVRELTELPLIVINTHGHPDHIGGNFFFDCPVYMNPRDNALADSFIRLPGFADKLKKAGRSMPPFLPISGGDVVDLGGVRLEVIDLPGHTPGSILLLNPEDGTLFTGDAINWHTWMQLECSLPMHEFLDNLERLAPRLAGVKQILHGHSQGFDAPELLVCHREAVREVVEGKTEGDRDYHYFGGTVKAHAHRVPPMRIIYDPARPL